MAKEKPNIIIALIIGLILIILSSFFTSITDSIYLAIGEFITFKWLINIIFLLVLLIFLINYYYKKTIYSSLGKEIIKINSSKSNIKKEIENNLSQSDIEETNKYILRQLSTEEKLLLKEYIDNDTKTMKFSIRDGVAMGLISVNVLYISSKFGRGLKAIFPFNLQPWAWEMLKKNPKYLKV